MARGDASRVVAPSGQHRGSRARVPPPCETFGSDVLAAQQAPEYLEAKRLYAAKDYRGALATVNRLLESRSWSPSDRKFLVRQRTICERALGIQPTPQFPKRAERRPEDADCGPRSLTRVAREFGKKTSVADLRRLAATTGYGTSLEGLAKAAKAIGLEAEGLQMDRHALGNLDTPAILWVDGSHYLALLAVHGDKAQVYEPLEERESRIPLDDLMKRSRGILLRVSLPPGKTARRNKLCRPATAHGSNRTARASANNGGPSHDTPWKGAA